MPTFCDCQTCRDVKNRINNPECVYCHKHHDSKIECPERVKITKSIGPEYLEYVKIRKLMKEEKCPSCGEPHKVGQTKCHDVKAAIASIIKNSSEYYLELADGKYTIYQEKMGAVKALRYGEPWRDLCGDNLIFYLMVELIEAKERIRYALEAMDSLDWNKGFLIEILEGEKHGYKKSNRS